MSTAFKPFGYPPPAPRKKRNTPFILAPPPNSPDYSSINQCVKNFSSINAWDYNAKPKSRPGGRLVALFSNLTAADEAIIRNWYYLEEYNIEILFEWHEGKQVEVSYGWDKSYVHDHLGMISAFVTSYPIPIRVFSYYPECEEEAVGGAEEEVKVEAE